MRIAFITNEFFDEKSTGGGLGTYLARVTRALCEAGHSCEVFVASTRANETCVHSGLTVHRVKILTADRCIFKAVNWLLVRLFRELWSGPAGYINSAWHLSRALHAREKLIDFDFVQSTNCGGCGLLIRKKKSRTHVMRMSSKRDLWFRIDEKKGPGFRAMSFLEKIAARRVDKVYAPSRFLARECAQDWHVSTGVLRPPVFIETRPSAAVAFALPERFMIHFGTFARRKGSHVLARALKIVWEQSPDFTMVWCGSFDGGPVEAECRALFGTHASKVMFTGALPKAMLYAVIQRATAAVLPSLADNLPNTVIESLLLSVPVIGTRGASIDELVHHGVTGLLVEKNSETALAEALLSVWGRKMAFDFSGIYRQPVFAAMAPSTAAHKLACLDFEDIHASA